jgi:uncharacterized phosphosugar-binding protein
MATRQEAGGPSGEQPSAAPEFFDQAIRLLENLKRTRSRMTQEAAELCADRIAKGGLVFLFGNGHSRMLCHLFE